MNGDFDKIGQAGDNAFAPVDGIAGAADGVREALDEVVELVEAIATDAVVDQGSGPGQGGSEGGLSADFGHAVMEWLDREPTDVILLYGIIAFRFAIPPKINFMIILLRLF